MLLLAGFLGNCDTCSWVASGEASFFRRSIREHSKEIVLPKLHKFLLPHENCTDGEFREKEKKNVEMVSTLPDEAQHCGLRGCATQRGLLNERRPHGPAHPTVRAILPCRAACVHYPARLQRQQKTAHARMPSTSRTAHLPRSDPCCSLMPLAAAHVTGALASCNHPARAPSHTAEKPGTHESHDRCARGHPAAAAGAFDVVKDMVSCIRKDPIAIVSLDLLILSVTIVLVSVDPKISLIPYL